MDKIYVKGNELSQYTTEELYDDIIIYNLLVEGVALLAAEPKGGKTFMCLELAYKITQGLKYLCFDTKKANVLYIALEDSKKRIDKRYEKLGYQPDNNIEFAFIKDLNYFSLEDEILRAREEYGDNLKVVFVDTFTKIREQSEFNYASEYSEIACIHDIGVKYHLAIVLVMHIRQDIDYAHPFKNIYGSNGLLAGAYSMIVMLDDIGCNNKKTLHITGKDIEDQSYNIEKTENLNFIISEEQNVISNDEDIVKIANYIAHIKKYEGTTGDLAYKLKSKIMGPALAKKIKKHKYELQNANVEVEFERSSTMRKVILTYVDDDSNDSNDSKEEASPKPSQLS